MTQYYLYFNGGVGTSPTIRRNKRDSPGIPFDPDKLTPGFEVGTDDVSLSVYEDRTIVIHAKTLFFDEIVPGYRVLDTVFYWGEFDNWEQCVEEGGASIDGLATINRRDRCKK